jgi:hypothetical protein
MNIELFTLVRSLTKSEKRYFKLNASLFRENSSLVSLFNILDVQDPYNEKKVRQEFKKSNKIKQLAAAKNQLHDLILKSMRSYYKNKTIDHQIHVMFQNALFFLHKRLEKQVEKELVKIEKLANAHEKYDHLLVIKNIRSKILGARPTKLKYQETQALVSKIENDSHYELLYYEMTDMIVKAGHAARNKIELKKIKKIFNHPLFKNESLATSHVSKMFYYNAHYFYFRFIGDLPAAYNISRSFVQYIEQQQERIHQNPFAYRSALNNYLAIQLDIKKFDDFWEIIEKLRSMPGNYPKSNTENFKIGISLRVFEKQLGYYQSTLSCQEGMRLIYDIEKWLNSIEVNADSIEMGFDISLYMYAVNLFFMAAHFSEALKWLNKILNKTGQDVEIAKDIHAFARIINLLIHYEMHDLDLLEYKVRSSERFLLKEEKLFRIETEIIHFFRKDILKVNEGENTGKSFRSLKARLKKISNDPLEASFFKDFDFISWIDSKLEQRSFLDVLVEKNK